MPRHRGFYTEPPTVQDAIAWLKYLKAGLVHPMQLARFYTPSQLKRRTTHFNKTVKGIDARIAELQP